MEELPSTQPTADESLVDNQVRYYDNEWVRFVNQLSKNESLGKIAHFAASCKFTPRAKRKIISYTYALLGRNLAVTFIRNEHERNMLYCDKAVLDAVLKLGLTNFDITPEFEIIVDMISFQFSVMAFQATGGFERKQINTTERRISREEVYPQLREEVGTIRKFLSGKPDEVF